MTTYTSIESPLGDLTLTASGDLLTGLWFGDATPTGRRDDAEPIFSIARMQLDEYFAGARLTFDLPLAPAGTGFQKTVWQALLDIPYGVTVSYAELAEQIGNRKASRAVGLANGQNPIAIVIPCHRVIGANGKLVGYGGGLARKIALLDFEAAVRATGPQPFRMLGDDA
ncbi:MAG: methylated-DNA--[protein]-cysteine S-methyltransferase [Capsulimonadaceae bacterium]|nr:methylated-DNA--[protein]-cysteine S-methyltransferase [Capsulimonadaceae bacterium]